ncbi:DNA polymerase theta isoform X1 [Apis mellifera caucasica]|nr:DNA polymerase theta isoform X1 [Apis mellifera caucasica]
MTTNDMTNVNLSNSNSSINNTEKTSEINPFISIIPTQDRCKLSSWGLPLNILQKYEAKGVTTMFAWQVECLSNQKVIEKNCNLVYSAPTSAGKTLIAEILMIKTVLERQKKVIFILPFVSVVREKMYYFQDLLSDSGVRVEGFMGGIAPSGGFATTHIAIATIEKANSLINHLMEEKELINLGAVIVDELHLVGDPNRGYLLELLLTKLRYMTSRDENINIQLIGMSATLPNLSLLAKWLDAELYKTEFRPIPLNEQCKIGRNIYDNKLCLIRSLTPMPELTMDSDDILHLCIETISDGHSVLIFCSTKNWCEKLAEQIAIAFCKLGRENTQLGKILRDQLDSELISETLEQLKRSPTGLDNVLKNTVSFGIAFHHAGLTMDERDIIEGSFRSGSLRVLIATSTLSSGVNLPARRVIIRSPKFAGKLLDSLTYHQMIGRAGRMGKDTAGESILICKPNEQKSAEALISASLEPIESCLEDSAPLIRALLEAVASEVVYTPSDLELYINCTLVNLSNEYDSKDLWNKAIKFLVDNEFLLLQKTEEGHNRWVATAFGKACLAASIAPREGLLLLEELQKARRCFVLDTELHVIYLVTPLTSGNQIGSIDWMTFLELWKMLSESERRVGQLVGVEERFLTSAVRGIVRQGKLLSIHKRFYTALALHDLVREIPLNSVCKKYGCCRGVLQTLQQSASTFAGMITQFCKQLGWDCMELLVSQFQTRLQFGVCRELLDLLRLPMLNGLRARSLYKHGITSVADLAIANELDVERALYKALPFESEKEHDGEHESEAIKRNKMRTVFVTGKDGLTPHEAAIMLVQEARILVQNELKLQDMSWKQNERSIVTNESNTEVNLCIQQDMLKDIDVQINIESAKIIGSSSEGKKKSKKVENYTHGDKKLYGAAIAWESNIAYYISFSNEQDLKISGKEQMKLFKELLANTILYVKCFATKETFKTLYECCGIIASCKFLDPKVANWLYDGNIYEKTFNDMVKEYFPQGCFIIKKMGTCYDTGPGLCIKSAIPGELRACAEAVLSWHMADKLIDKLEQLSPTLLYTFKDIEMKIIILLAYMELTGLGVCLKSLQDLSSVIREEMISLEERAYALCGKKFNFSSSKEVGEILGLYKGKKISVNKAVLGQSDHPISNLVMSWRKLNVTKSKIIYPLLNLAQHSSRIHGNCVTSTLTGRISMHEPNLQNVPRDFNSKDNSFTISVRMAFIPTVGNIILSADYCQLELRILAHFSKDTILCNIMRKPGDIFKNIAAKWNHVSENEVDDKMRRHTKQLCYGMIYGMGVKTLAENLSVDEVKAKEFLESFMNAYPGISKWLNNVLEEARINGYITTILERRRMFPGLTSINPMEKSQAERQAVNTKVQGSAADIVKKAMIDIEKRMRFEFSTSLPIMPANSSRKLRSNSKETQHKGGYLVLQLHDELLYEVNIYDLRQVATIVKESMEQVCQLTVPLPVKLKVGPTWGNLSEYIIS